MLGGNLGSLLYGDVSVMLSRDISTKIIVFLGYVQADLDILGSGIYSITNIIYFHFHHDFSFKDNRAETRNSFSHRRPL